MKFSLAIFTVLSSVAPCFAANGVPGVEKISSSMLNYFGTRYVFYSPNFPNDRFRILMYMTNIGKYTYQNYQVFEDYEPRWADVTASVDTNPDVNVLTVANTVLYFTALEEGTNTTSIGVARCNKIVLEPGTAPFTPLSQPLVKSQQGENLTRPSLDLDEDGNLYLYYHNTSSQWSVGQIQRILLTKNGTALAGEPEVFPWIPSY